MCKKYFFVFTVLFCSLCFNAQEIGKYNFQNKSYYVYPYRISSDEIPLLGTKIPDGEYVVFEVYAFRPKFSFKKKKKYVMTDSSHVRAVITIKNNLAEGRAVFYDYDFKDNDKYKKKPSNIMSGNLIGGLKHGPWKTEDVEYESNELTNYENGIRAGYSYEYNFDNSIRKKEKYCDGKLCDTVFRYSNGKIVEEYDVDNDKQAYDVISIYTEALRTFGDNRLKAKTYYKRYNGDGSLRYDLKFKDGSLQPFDSIGVVHVSKEPEYNYTKYVTIKNIDKDKKVLSHYNNDRYGLHTSETYYYKGFNYFEKTYEARKRYKRKFISRKLIVTKGEITNRETYNLHPDSVDYNSSTPVVVGYVKQKTKKYETKYIPKYRLVYNEEKENILKQIDTTSGSIYFTNKRLSFPDGPLSRTAFVKYISNDDQNIQEEKINPFLSKKFILIESIDLKPKRYEYYNSAHFALKSKNFEKTNLSSTYAFNDTLLNGPYCFSYNKKAGDWPKNKRMLYYVSYDDNATTGNFKDGKKDGLWQEIDWKKTPKKIPNDFKDYFFKNSKNMNGLTEQNYKNGMRDGKAVIYNKTNTKKDAYDDEDRYFTGVDQNIKGLEEDILYKKYEMEFKNDTLNGLYKKYYSNGAIKVEAYFVTGRPDGDYKKYNKQHELTALIQFTKGNLNGNYIHYEDNIITCFASFKNNVLKDSLIYYYSDGKPLTRIYTDNEKVKSKKTYFSNGKLKEEIIFNSESQYMLAKETISSESFVSGLKLYNGPTTNKANAIIKNYYENGQKLSEGSIRNGALVDVWKFYSINGQLIHNVNFRDTIIVFNNDSTTVHGIYNGFYSNGNKRCKGYISNIELSYDCFTKQDKADLDFYVIDFFDINGKQTIKSGNGYFVKYDPNGLRIADGKLVNSLADSLWRFYTPEQKLNGIGYYIKDEKDGVWYSGDLEGINFEDGACFDMNNPSEVKAYEEKRKFLDISRTIYKNGIKIDNMNFSSNLNKTYKPRRGHHYDSF